MLFLCSHPLLIHLNTPPTPLHGRADHLQVCSSPDSPSLLLANWSAIYLSLSSTNAENTVGCVRLNSAITASKLSFSKISSKLLIDISEFTPISAVLFEKNPNISARRFRLCPLARARWLSSFADTYTSAELACCTSVSPRRADDSGPIFLATRF